MKIFIVQPMRGRSSDEINHERVLAASWAMCSYPNAEIVNMEMVAYLPINKLYALSLDLGRMSLADVVIFLPGWKGARGCRIMHDCAKAYEKETVYVSVAALERAEKACAQAVSYPEELHPPLGFWPRKTGVGWLEANAALFASDNARIRLPNWADGMMVKAGQASERGYLIMVTKTDECRWMPGAGEVHCEAWEIWDKL